MLRLFHYNPGRETDAIYWTTFQTVKFHLIHPLWSHVIPYLQRNVEHGRPGWTTNNVESINRVLKNASQWKQNKIPALFDTIKAVVKFQLKNLKTAMYGEGDYQLKACLQPQFGCTYEKWISLDAKGSKRRMERCFRPIHGGSTSTPTTIDGNLTVIQKPTAGNKRNQCKRPPNDRTQTKRRRQEW